jgi:hypothetical protein
MFGFPMRLMPGTGGMLRGLGELRVDIMRELAFWSEVGLSELEEAAIRREAILTDADHIPFHELDQKMKTFISELAEQYPTARIESPGGEGKPYSDLLYSRYGVLL